VRYLGLDVHSGTTVWHLLDAAGNTTGRGKTETTAPALTALVQRLGESDELLCGQEVGTSCYFVHDTLTAAGVKVLSFNAQQLKMIASSRKKTDKRDAFWIAKALQTGMTPHPVYIPSGQERRLRQLLSQREAMVHENQRWLLRSKSAVRAAGLKTPRAHTVAKLRKALLDAADGLDESLVTLLERGVRMQDALMKELTSLEKEIRSEAEGIDAVARLQTIPGVGPWVAVTIYAWVGDASRFPSARRLTAYAGLVPSVWQSGDADARLGGITSQGSALLRSKLVQAGHVLLGRCRSKAAAPLQAPPIRVHTTSKRRKVAVVAAARHILRIAYYILRDGTKYHPERLAPAPADAAE
jgi:transposase